MEGFASHSNPEVKVNDLFISCRTPTEKKRLVRTLSLPEGRLTISDRQETKNVELQGFDFNAYLSDLGSRELGQTLIYGERVTSTQTLLYTGMPAAPSGAAFTCYRQSTGRGRGSNTWESPVGCLCFSYKFTAYRPEVLVYLQYLCCVVMIDSIKSFPGAEDLDIRIKWPNDIYSGPSFGAPVKLGGILAQSTSNQGAFDIVIGIGLNVSNSEPTTCLNTLLARAGSSLGAIPPERLLARFLTSFESSFAVLERRGFSAFENRYLQLWLHSGQEVTVGDSQERLRIVGLSPGGYLRAQAIDRPAQVYELQPDGNSFDFFRGLIVAKKL